ncbi:hypothetical protein Tco_1540682 [Tanacetum coccineum]
MMTTKGLNKAEIVRILAGQLITAAVMAGASSLSIVSLSEPHRSSADIHGGVKMLADPKWKLAFSDQNGSWH